MARRKIWTNWNTAVLMSLLSCVSLAAVGASNVAGCNETGIEINIQNTTSSGNLTSPNYPDWTPANSLCVWILTCPPGRLIKLYFNEVMFSKNHSYLEIRDGMKSSSNLIINVTGGKLNEMNDSMPVIYSSGQKVSLRLKKGLGDATGSMRFHISYSYIKPGKSCSEKNSDDENNNILLTPPFLLKLTAADLSSEVDCTWKITPSIKGILMNSKLDVRKDLFCKTGSVSVFDGPYGSAGKLKHNFCQELGDSSSSSSSFTSDVGLSFQVKSSNFSSVVQIQASEEDCVKGGYTIYVPLERKFNTSSCSKTRCQRMISSTSGLLRFRIVFISFPSKCENNSLQVFEVHKHSNKMTLRAKFCASRYFHQVFPDLVIYSGQALIKLQTEAASKAYGFFAEYYAVGRSTDVSYCSAYNSPEKNANLKQTGRSGYISAPAGLSSISSSPYPPGMLCRWIIQPMNVTEKEQIKLRFTKFDFSKGYDKDCAQDHVQFEFSNGREEKYCRATGDPSVVYSGNAKSVNITFVSTPLYTGNYGFSIDYDVVPIVPGSSPPSRHLSWAVIGVLIGISYLLTCK